MNILFHTNAPVPNPFRHSASTPLPNFFPASRPHPLNLARPPVARSDKKWGGVAKNFATDKFIDTNVKLEETWLSR